MKNDVVIRSEIWEAFFDTKSMSIDDLAVKIGRTREELCDPVTEMIISGELCATIYGARDDRHMCIHQKIKRS